MITDDDILVEFRRIIEEVLTECYANLERLLKATMKPFAAKMFSHWLISSEVNKALNFSDIMSEFLVGMNFTSDSHEICCRCQVFLDGLFDQGGPLKGVAHYIAKKWTTKIKSRLNVDITFDLPQ